MRVYLALKKKRYIYIYIYIYNIFLNGSNSKQEMSFFGYISVGLATVTYV